MSEEPVHKRADRARRNRPWQRSFRHMRRQAVKPLVRYLGVPLFRLYAGTWRTRIEAASPEDRDRFLNQGALGIFWHGRALPTLRTFRDHKAAVLVSPSGDGELFMLVLSRLGFGIVRGSRSRGGAKAMREMIDVLSSGTVIAITPDGPRGPMHSITDGVAFLSHKTGYPVVPVGIAVDRLWRLNSWDAFNLPKPFARIRAWVGDPIQVPREASEEDLREITLRLRAALLEAERVAARRLAGEDVVADPQPEEHHGPAPSEGAAG